MASSAARSARWSGRAATCRARQGSAPSAASAAALIDSAVTAVKGDLTNKEGMRKEMEKANFKSVRGDFRFGNNHIPIQNFYLQDAVKNADGSYSLKTVATIVKDDQDRFHDKCPMK